MAVVIVKIKGISEGIWIGKSSKILSIAYKEMLIIESGAVTRIKPQS